MNLIRCFSVRQNRAAELEFSPQTPSSHVQRPRMALLQFRRLSYLPDSNGRSHIATPSGLGLQRQSNQPKRNIPEPKHHMEPAWLDSGFDFEILCLFSFSLLQCEYLGYSCPIVIFQNHITCNVLQVRSW